MEVWVTASFAFAGVALGKICEVIVEKIKLKGKKDDAMAACKKEHADKLDKMRDEFNRKFEIQDEKQDEQDAKIDQVCETLIELKGMLQNLSSLFEMLSSRVEKNNNVIERTYRLEERQAADHERIKEIEKREEHRAQG
jgi:hypothetical protein